MPMGTRRRGPRTKARIIRAACGAGHRILDGDLADSWSLWNSVAGSDDAGFPWRRRYLELTYGAGAYRSCEGIIEQAAAEAGVPPERAAQLMDRWGELAPCPETFSSSPVPPPACREHPRWECPSSGATAGDCGPWTPCAGLTPRDRTDEFFAVHRAAPSPVPRHLSTVHKHRDLAVRDHPRRLGPDELAGDAFSAVRSHDDQIAAVQPRRLDDRLVR